MALTKEFIISMSVGAYLANPMNGFHVPEDWCGSEECGDFAYAVNKYMEEHRICYLGIMSTENVTKDLFNFVIGGDNLPVRPDHDEYDEFARGFLAGEIFGSPTYDTLEQAEKAENIWNKDASGYYQEVLNAVKNGIAA